MAPGIKSNTLISAPIVLLVTTFAIIFWLTTRFEGDNGAWIYYIFIWANIALSIGLMVGNLLNEGEDKTFDTPYISIGPIAIAALLFSLYLFKGYTTECASWTTGLVGALAMLTGVVSIQMITPSGSARGGKNTVTTKRKNYENWPMSV